MEIVIAAVVADIPIPVVPERAFEPEGSGEVLYIYIFLGIIIYISRIKLSLCRVIHAHDARYIYEVTGGVRRKFSGIGPVRVVPAPCPGIYIRMFVIIPAE